MSRVLVVPRQLKSGSQRFHQILNEAGFAVEYFPSDLDPMETQSMIETLKQGDFDAVLAGSEPYTDSVLEVAPLLRVIARVGVGYDAVDLEAASHRKIAVTIAPGTNEEAVAEHTIAMLLCIGRNLVVRDRDVRNAQWKRVPVLAPVRSCYLGIVGLGRIGREVAIRAQAMGMRVVAYEPYPDRDFVRERSIDLVELEELFEKSDYITLHVPMNSETAGMINRESLARMKTGSVLINTARGGLIKEKDLLEALKEGPLAAAALDVLETEPADETNPLLLQDNILLTPHIAGIDTLSVANMAEKAAQVVVDLNQGQWPDDAVVNPQLKSEWKW